MPRATAPRLRTSDLRKAIPAKVKIEVLCRQARCWSCEDVIGSAADFEIVRSRSGGHAPAFCAIHFGCYADFHSDAADLNQAGKLALLTSQAKCAVCGESLVRFEAGAVLHFVQGIAVSSVRFDHRPALEARPLNRSKTDFIPPQHDPDAIEAIHPDCHQWRTTGRKPGAAKTVTTLGSDTHNAAKVRRARKKRSTKWKRKIPSRPFAAKSRSPSSSRKRSRRFTRTGKR